MPLTKAEIFIQFDIWLKAWNEHNLERVIDLFHPEIFFQNWNGTEVCGKDMLEKVWGIWFENHGNFKFSTEDLFIDEQAQKIAFSWTLEWPSLEKKYVGQQEIRRGMDILHLEDGKIIKKITYSKTLLQINNHPVNLFAE